MKLSETKLFKEIEAENNNLGELIKEFNGLSEEEQIRLDEQFENEVDDLRINEEDEN
jgi:hypothetical protein